ncbi:hypothetical protein R1flu_023411 [Riccia fluitans]|uniref:Uncharacterized protein n=1 Tax=Riccia fluitans TaxID=41844 RepID=A0ABD1XRY3_9MARC
MADSRITNRSSVVGASVVFFVLTVCLCIPAIVLLASDTTYRVFTFSIIALCLLFLPFLIWIPIAVSKCLKMGAGDLEMKEVYPQQQVDGTTEVELKGQPYPDSASISPTAGDVDCSSRERSIVRRQLSSNYR